MSRSEVLHQDAVSRTLIYADDEQLVLRDEMTPFALQAIKDQNARVRNDNHHNPRAQGKHVATIPIAIYTNWKREWRSTHADKWSWQTYLAMKLNSPDWKYLKTITGNV